MAKKITKTVTIYVYTFKMCNKKTNKVEDVKIESFAEAKNPTQLRVIFETSKHAKDNYFVCGDFTDTRFEQYSMPLDDFVKVATKIELPEDSDNVKKDNKEVAK